MTQSGAPRLFILELTWLEPMTQSEPSTWSAVNLKKKLTSISSKLEPAILSRVTGHIGIRVDDC